MHSRFLHACFIGTRLPPCTRTTRPVEVSIRHRGYSPRPKRRAIALAFAMVGVSCLTTTGTSEAGDVAVILSAKVDAYQQAIVGFLETSGHQIVATYDMKGDIDSGPGILAEIESQVKPDLIFAVGIWALQTVSPDKTDLPVVYAMVLNPSTIVGSGAMNITGASMNVPVDRTFRLLQQLNPDIRRVGTLYSHDATGYLIEQANVAAKELGFELVAKEIKSPKQAIKALKTLKNRKIDVLWVVPDKTILAPSVMNQMLLFSYRHKVPLVGLSKRQVKMGALLSLSFASSEDIGRQAGELAALVLSGKSVAELPYTTARKVNLIVNLKAAKKLKMKMPEGLLKKAKLVIK